MERIIEITNHAYDRANERLSLDKSSFARLASKAFNEGFTHSDAKSQLKKYLDKIWFQHKTSNNVRLYGENIFFFKNNVLITVYQLPFPLRKYLKVIKKNVHHQYTK